MVQVKAINTRKVNKVDGHTIFNMVKNMTGADEAEILTVITPDMVPMIGRNEASARYSYYRSNPKAETWDIDQQVSWGNALKWLQQWQEDAKVWKKVEEIASQVPTANTPPVVQSVKATPFPPLSKQEKEKMSAERMVYLLTQTHRWNEQKKAKKGYLKMTYPKLKNTFLTIRAPNYPLYNKSQSQREDLITKHITAHEDQRRRTFYQDTWEKSLGSREPSVLMMMGQPHPTYFMAWIVAKTYQANNPEVKNIAGYEGRYKYRNWELKERYYPAIRQGDTLPKTTAQWPRYTASPSILNDFTMQEVAQALKSNFGGVLQAKKDVHKGQITKAVDAMKQRRDAILQNPTHALQSVLAQGIDQYNEHNLKNYAAYYTSPGHQRKMIPTSQQVTLTYGDFKKKLGATAYNKVIKQYEDKQKGIMDSTVKTAKDNYKTALANVSAAKAAKIKKSIRPAGTS